MTNPYYDPELLQRWRERISRLRVTVDMLAPWDVDPDTERWKRGLGHGPAEEDTLNLHMIEWQTWLCSLSADQRLAYQQRHPEPPAWHGFYDFVLYRFPKPSGVPEGMGSDVYWDSLAKHYENLFGVV